MRFPDLPELSNMLSKESVDALQSCKEQGDNGPILKSVFQSLITSDKTIVATTLLVILDRLSNEGKNWSLTFNEYLNKLNRN